MKIAVTGASGFIGEELLAELANIRDIEVIALTRGSTDNKASSDCTWRRTDYSADSLAEALKGVQVVYHLAGVRGTDNDSSKYSANLEITENLLESMMRVGVRRIVFSSTVSVYNGKNPMPWKEDDPIRGYGAYGDSKADCERAIINCSENGGITYGIVRIAQVLGEGEKRRGMMNVFLDTARRHGTIKVMGKSIIKRQYIYVKDLVKVLTIMVTDPEVRERNLLLNVGMPNAYSNLEIANMVNKVFENQTPIEYEDSYPEAGRSFFMDISRMKEELKYEPLDMREALEDVKSMSNIMNCV